MVSPGETKFTSEVNTRLIRYTRARLSEIEPFQGFWEERPEDNQPGERYWCVGNIDGAINFIRNMAEWTVTISLFEFDEHCHARPIMGVVHAPAMGITYMAAKGQGAIRIRRNPVGGRQAREGHAVDHCDVGWLRGQLRHVVCAGGVQAGPVRGSLHRG